MARSSGLSDFMRREYARNQGAEIVSPAKLAATVEQAQRQKLKPYRLPEESANKLRAAATPSCFRCKGTGVSKWKHSGTVALVCKCAQENLKKAEAYYEQVRQQLQEQVDAAKAAEKTDGNVVEANQPEGLPAGEVRKED